MKDDQTYIEHISLSILIHDYMGVDTEVVWATIQLDVPELEDLLKKI